jgi:hypothetical protein
MSRFGYSSYMDAYDEDNTCPLCGLDPVQVCKCPNKDSVCSNGHEWHYKNGKRIQGSTHKPQQQQPHQQHQPQYQPQYQPHSQYQPQPRHQPQYHQQPRPQYQQQQPSNPHITAINCPVCGSDISKRCNCPKKDCMCIQGHIWHYDNNHLIIDRS